MTIVLLGMHIEIEPKLSANIDTSMLHANMSYHLSLSEWYQLLQKQCSACSMSGM